jgi:hypothetical protein
MHSDTNTTQTSNTISTPSNNISANSLTNLGVSVIIADIRNVFRILYGNDTILGTDDFLQNAIRITIRVLESWKEVSTQRNTGLIVPSIQNGRIMEQVYTWATGMISGSGNNMSYQEVQKWTIIVQVVAQRLGYYV